MRHFPRSPKLVSLRRELGAITKDKNVGNHAAKIRALSQTHPNTIEVLNWQSDLSMCTCGMYVFGFHDWSLYPKIAERGPFAGAEFINWLLYKKHLRPLQSEQFTLGSLICYFDVLGQDVAWKHIGRALPGSRVESKWGTGLALRHAIWEVPDSYGHVLECYAPISADHAQQLFKLYLREEWHPSIWEDLLN